MGTLINALKEIFSGSSQTSPTNIPTCASDGTPNGNVNMANLASVLGENPTTQKMEVLNNVDLNTVGVGMSSSYRTVIVRGTVSNAPSGTDGGYLEIFRWNIGGYLMQIFKVDTSMWFRYSGQNGTGWNGWSKVTFDMPTFYKNYANVSALATALGVRFKRFDQNNPIDFNNLAFQETIIAGYYNGASCQNCPVANSDGIMFAINKNEGSGVYLQLIFASAGYGASLWVKQRWGSNIREWVKIY